MPTAAALSHDARLLEVKIALEAELRPTLLAMLMSHAEARLSGQKPITLPALEKLLLRHYARTVMIVTGRRPPHTPTLGEAAISFTHGERLRLRARAHAQLILAGLERDIARANVWHADSEAGATKTAETKDVADRVRRGYVGLVALLGRAYDRISGRIGGIANAETNGVAEEARFEVAAGETAANATLFKVWSTMLDAKVRPAHAAAEGQGSNGSVRAEAPFTVGGERLMFPGDTSLGASLGNVINCRCSAAYFARTADGTMVDISQTPRLTPLSPRNLGGGRGRPLTPTTAVTLNEGTRGTIVLADLSTATLTYRDGVLTVTRNGAQLGWGTITVDASGRLTAEAITVGLGAESLGIAELIARSIATTNDWRASAD